ncbi:MAG: hypothetical protein AAF485_12130 [Chloroflexota bacterium]
MKTLEHLEASRDFIDENFSQPLWLEDLAQQAHLSRYRFIRSFDELFMLHPTNISSENDWSRPK